MTSLNPVHRIGAQIGEMLEEHTNLGKREIDQRTIDLLGEVGIPRPQERVRDYPHQFSGGMRQRVMIAMALACRPSLLLADEPTTALDVTIQAQVLRLIKRMKEQHGSAVIIITHDFGVIVEIADKVLVMYAGKAVETGSVRDIFKEPQHPYTWGLLESIPSLDRPRGGRLPSIKGMPPSLIDPAPGCSFMPRCSHAFEQCKTEPPLERSGQTVGHLDRCWLSVEYKNAHRRTEVHGERREAS